jgi:two-component system, OmpR family, alkaline phosphatase synthesis response regulator PhoP
MKKKKVVIIEDDQDLLELLKLHVADSGCEVVGYKDGLKGWKYLSSNPFDLLILDIGLPGLDGMEICRRMREENISSPVLMLTARIEEADKVMGLESGADDYITKPFSILELMARIKAIFRRVEIDTNSVRESFDVLEIQGIQIDRRKRKLIVNSKSIELTPKEFDLLNLLASNPGQTYTRQQLLEQLWGNELEGYEYKVNTHINRLRAKVEKDPDQPEFILTTWGTGYRFKEYTPSKK